MDSELKNKIKAKLNVCSQAVNGMMQTDIDEEEKAGWIAIYNGAMKKILNDYLAEEVVDLTQDVASEDEPAEDIGGITNSPETPSQ